ncbi:MAG: hypothetical protein LBI96_06555 [Odoribacteraceae bacterium]|jgi:hypothetical protein|nr:hypothetical protein [Odoribacteraceae bacterium]
MNAQYTHTTIARAPLASGAAASNRETGTTAALTSSYSRTREHAGNAAAIVGVHQLGDQNESKNNKNQIKTAMKKFWQILVCIPFLATACVHDITPETTSEESAAQLRVKFVMQVPGQPTVQSRSMDATAETTITRVDVLAFKVTDTDEVYDYLASATDITVGDGTRQFSVRLLKSDDSYRFIILANLPDSEQQRLQHLTGKTKDEILPTILYPHPGKWTADGATAGQFTPLPMWAETGITRVDDNLASAGISGVSLTRALAKFDVQLTTDQARDAFTLEKIYLYNRASRGRIIPAKERWYATPPKPSIPENNDPSNPLVIREPLLYNVPTSQATAFTRAIYTFETAAPAAEATLDATCIVVGGAYNGSETSYYRLDIKDAQGNFRDILRNHAYGFNITKVSGKGYPTPEQAFRSAPVNIQAEVVEWNEGNIPNVIFDGQNILGVSKPTFEFYRDAQEENEEINRLVVFTDYQTSEPAESGWKITPITYTGASTDWLTLSRASGTAHVETTLYLYLLKNETGAPRVATFQITAGRLKYQVKVEQSERPAILISISDEDNNPVEQMTFTAFTAEKPAPRSFTVRWKPKEDPLTVLVTNIGDGMTTGKGQPTAGQLTADGSKTFTVAPDAVTPSASAPFVERTTLYTFSLNTGGQKIVKNIILQQINHAVVTDLPGRLFLMNGAKQTFNLKANFPWKIELVDDNSSLLSEEFLTQYGGNNTATGDQVQFRLRDFLSSYNPSNPLQGSITLRLSRKNEKNEYQPVATYELPCIAAITRGNANSYMVAPTDFPILVPLAQVKRAMTGSIALPANWLAEDISKLTVKILWQDTDGNFNTENSVVRAVQLAGTTLSNAYIIVVPGKKTGNAGIGLFDGATIKWSWHIWNTTYTPGDGTTAHPIPNPASNSKTSVQGGHVYRFLGKGGSPAADFVWMDRNIGSLSAGADVNAVMYQWGRKDPFPGPSDPGKVGTPRTWYYNTTAAYASQPVMATMETATRTPLTRYQGTGKEDQAAKLQNWLTGTTKDAEPLWGRTTGNTVVTDKYVDQTTGKSVFDPCPEGWRVPDGTSTKSPWPGDVNTTITGNYPLAGSMLSNSSTYTLEAGRYWTATPVDSPTFPHNSFAGQWSSAGTTQATTSVARATLSSVRCIREK